MQVTLTIDYAMWILTLLGKTTERINAATMSERLHIPRRYTIKILNRLKESGLVEVCAGVKGGYHLARGLDEISFGDVAKAMGQSIKISKCLEDGGGCTFGKKEECNARCFYQALQEKLEEGLFNVTLQEIQRP